VERLTYFSSFPERHRAPPPPPPHPSSPPHPLLPKPQGKASTSILTIEVLPQDSETNLEEMEKYVRGLEKDGLKWEGSSIVPFMFGMSKLNIVAMVDDQKIESLTEILEAELVKGGENPYVSEMTIVDCE
jgi:translation elongation factor EF-1beta